MQVAMPEWFLEELSAVDADTYQWLYFRHPDVAYGYAITRTPSLEHHRVVKDVSADFLERAREWLRVHRPSIANDVDGVLVICPLQ